MICKAFSDAGDQHGNSSRVWYYFVVGNVTVVDIGTTLDIYHWGVGNQRNKEPEKKITKESF